MLIQELLLLREEAAVELAALVKLDPKHVKNAVKKLWGTDKLLYMGQPLFKGNDLGPVYDAALKAAEEFIDDSEGDVIVTIFDIDVHMSPSDSQECYLGYDPKKDELWVGFDMWANEEEFNQKFDDEYPDDSDPESETYKEAWENWKKDSFVGGLFRLSSDDGKEFTVKEHFEAVGGFYKGIYGSNGFKLAGIPKLLDLRLD